MVENGHSFHHVMSHKVCYRNYGLLALRGNNVWLLAMNLLSTLNTEDCETYLRCAWAVYRTVFLSEFSHISMIIRTNQMTDLIILLLLPFFSQGNNALLQAITMTGSK